ncbi:MAG TPA: 4-hydroxy-3-methylbut-2-enyl diphosphate reductase, partial [Candidatus Marinimicrobia bacterium]|nr:4-hydroxy-3-methylbut-2-enyl diphosphate reductase [Candidatus Neomarinimicrobiota bacterium]
KDLSEKCDVMVVIGSFTSANSNRLTQLALERNDRSYQVTSADDLNSDWFNESDVVGITAGASTPDNIIKNVTEKIKSFSNNLEGEMIYE